MTNTNPTSTNNHLDHQSIVEASKVSHLNHKSIMDKFWSAVGMGPVVYEAKDEPTYQYDGKRLSNSDFERIRPIVFAELSNRSPEKQELEARSIYQIALNRLTDKENRWKADNLAAVFTQPKQFQGYDPSNPKSQYNQYLNPQDEPTKLKKQKVDEILNKIEGEIKGGSFKNDLTGYYFYTHKPDSSLIATQEEPSYNK